jgi:hypothetical protein
MRGELLVRERSLLLVTPRHRASSSARVLAKTARRNDSSSGVAARNRRSNAIVAG